MRIRLTCTNEKCLKRFTSVPICADGFSISCVHCDTSHPLHATHLAGAVGLEQCSCCNGEELYVRKDFPQKCGLLLVVGTSIASLVLFGLGAWKWAVGILLGVMVIDAIIYLWVPVITACYRCRSEFLDGPVNPKHQGFDLATAEKYRT